MTLLQYRMVGALAGLLACAVCSLSGCSREETPPPGSALPVQTAAVEAATQLPVLRLPGVVIPRDDVVLSFKLGGVVADVLVRPGDVVRANQPLARLEQGDAEAQLAAAREAHDKAQRDFARAERLQAEDVIPLQALQDQRAQAKIAAAQWEAVRFTHARAVIRAPRDARVLRRLAEPAELVAPGQPVLVLGTAGAGLVLRVGASDRDVMRLRQGMPAEVQLDALPGSVLKATVVQVAAAADEGSGLFEVQLALQDVPAGVSAGMVGRALLSQGAAAPGLVQVPMAAVLEGHQQRAAVFVEQAGTVQRRAVDVAWIDGERVVLRSGVAVGERVVTAGAPYLRDGDAVRLP
jgi:membrane fusion protein, multidrug efflux system